MFDTGDYIVQSKGGALDRLKGGVSHAFVIHYFKSNVRDFPKRFGPEMALYQLIKETCPDSDKVMQAEFRRNGKVSTKPHRLVLTNTK